MPQAALGQHRPSDARANIAAFAILAGTNLRKVVLTTLVVSAGCGGAPKMKKKGTGTVCIAGGQGRGNIPARSYQSHSAICRSPVMAQTLVTANLDARPASRAT